MSGPKYEGYSPKEEKAKNYREINKETRKSKRYNGKSDDPDVLSVPKEPEKKSKRRYEYSETNTLKRKLEKETQEIGKTMTNNEVAENLIKSGLKDEDIFEKNGVEGGPTYVGVPAVQKKTRKPRNLGAAVLDSEEKKDAIPLVKSSLEENFSESEQETRIENLVGKKLYAKNLTESMEIKAFDKSKKKVLVLFNDSAESAGKNKKKSPKGCEISVSDFELKLKKYFLTEEEVKEKKAEESRSKNPTQKDADEFEIQPEISNDGRAYANGSVPDDAKEQDSREKSWKKNQKDNVDNAEREKEWEELEIYIDPGTIYWKSIEKNTDWISYEPKDKENILLGMTKAFLRKKIKEDMPESDEKQILNNIKGIIEKIKASL